MKRILHNFINNGKSNGLLLINQGTGTGKTYNVLKYIHDESLKEENKNKVYIFTTTLKKNLPEKDLENMFIKSGHEKEFKKKFLLINSMSEEINQVLNKDLEDEIPSLIKNSEEYKQLIKKVNAVNQVSNSIEVINEAKDQIRNTYEPKFRRSLELKLKQLGKNYDQKLAIIENNKDWNFVKKLYPNIYTKKRQIIFLSMSKLLAKNTPIIENSYSFCDADFLDRSEIFIDEFDATKETCINNITENSEKNQLDLIELFYLISHVLKDDKFPKNLIDITNSEENYDRYLRPLIDRSREISEEWYIDELFKTGENIESSKRNILFNDNSYHTILSDNKKFVVLRHDGKKNINSIEFVEKIKKELGQKNIQTMFRNISGFISYFESVVEMIASNYKKRKDQERSKQYDDVFSYEAAVRTVLSVFRLEGIYMNWLTNQIISGVRISKKKLESVNFDSSIYEKGFRYYLFEDDDNHDLNSKVRLVSMDNTPEKIILKFCSKAKVVGLSATCKIPSVIGNYDLEYLKEKLGDCYYNLSEEENDILKKINDDAICNYNKTNIHAEIVDSVCKLDNWRAIAPNDEIAESLLNLVENSPGNKNEFNRKKLFKICYVYKQFLDNKIQSFICLLNALPSEKSTTLNSKLIDKLFGYIKNGTEIKEEKVLQNYTILNGNNFEDNKNSLLNSLKGGKKCFVISCYKTIGAGQNLQYEIPESLKEEIVTINNHAARKEKDFDAIYLEKPTYRIVNIEEDSFSNDTRALLKYIYQIESLYEVGELSEDNAVLLIKRAFKKNFGIEKYEKKSSMNLYNLESIRLYGMITIIQAIGRTCRTNQKSKDIFIYADSDIEDIFDKRVLNTGFYNQEVLELAKKFEERESENLQDKYINLANKQSKNAYQSIQHILNAKWNDKLIILWRGLRELVMKYPTFNSEEDQKITECLKNLYIKCPDKTNTIYYYEENDYSKIDVSFNANSNHPYVVSDKDCRLDKLMDIKALKEFFENEGYCTEFKKGDYIMSPAIYHNIYLGALGELVGKYLFDYYKIANIEEIKDNEKFEKFDYKVTDKSIYIDFKHWKQSTQMDREEVISKARTKAKICNSKFVVLVELINSEKLEIKRNAQEEVMVLEVPGLLYEHNDKLQINSEIIDELTKLIEAEKNENQQNSLRVEYKID